MREEESVTAESDAAWPAWIGRLCGGLRWLWQWLSLVTILAVMAAIPVIQLIAFGYLLDLAGRLARGGRLSETNRWMPLAGRLGLAALAIFVVAQPVRLLVHWATVAELISPGSPSAANLRVGALLVAVAGLLHLIWAWARGGLWWHYLWPQPRRWMSQGWRLETWLSASDRAFETLRSLELGRLFWIGLRGAIGTLVWLLPATIIIVANRGGSGSGAGFLGALALLALGLSLLYLPMLQANFAAENRLRAMFDVATIRSDFRRAPWSWWAAMVVTLVVLPIPLYLLKIEPPPPQLLWMPTWFFIALALPARAACGLAIGRARRSPLPHGALSRVSRWTARVLMVPVVGTYLTVVYLSQYVAWDGLQTWVQQHAVLVPVPFVGL